MDSLGRLCSFPALSFSAFTWWTFLRKHHRNRKIEKSGKERRTRVTLLQKRCSLCSMTLYMDAVGVAAVSHSDKPSKTSSSSVTLKPRCGTLLRKRQSHLALPVSLSFNRLIIVTSRRRQDRTVLTEQGTSVTATDNTHSDSNSVCNSPFGRRLSCLPSCCVFLIYSASEFACLFFFLTLSLSLLFYSSFQFHCCLLDLQLEKLNCGCL